MNISGIIPALITPFNDNYEVNYEALKELVEKLIADGASGFYACGSTAECFLMNEDERKKVLETVIKVTNDRVPVIAHIGNIGSEKTCELARHAREVGAAAVSSVPPFYYKFGFDEIVSYYADIAKAVPELPLIVYNIPMFAGVEINADNLKAIVDASGAKGLKYTAYNLYELDKISRRYPDMKLFCGHDEIFSNALPIGIDGAIGSTFNVMTPKFVELDKQYKSGNQAAVEKLQREVNELIEVMIKVGVNSSIKYLLTKSGISCGDCRRPFAKVNEEQAKCLDAIYSRVFDK